MTAIHITDLLTLCSLSSVAPQILEALGRLGAPSRPDALAALDELRRILDEADEDFAGLARVTELGLAVVGGFSRREAQRGRGPELEAMLAELLHHHAERLTVREQRHFALHLNSLRARKALTRPQEARVLSAHYRVHGHTKGGSHA